MSERTETPAKPPHARAGVCIHATATIGPYERPSCGAGVVYRELVGSEPGWAGRLPCHAVRRHQETPPVPCAHRQEPTADQIAAWRSYVDAGFAKITEAARRVRAQHKETGAFQGEVECPACGKALRWSMARSNKHVHAACETRGCVSWMQ